MKKPNLILETILNKKFPVELLGGYSSFEVDKFLDLIIEDYQIHKSTIETLEQKLVEKNGLLENREDEIRNLELKIENLKVQLKESNKATNYELLKEIKRMQNKNNE